MLELSCTCLRNKVAACRVYIYFRHESFHPPVLLVYTVEGANHGLPMCLVTCKSLALAH